MAGLASRMIEHSVMADAVARRTGCWPTKQASPTRAPGVKVAIVFSQGHPADAVFHPERQSQGHRHLQTEQKWLPLFRSLAQVIVRCNAVEIDSQIERFYWRRFRGRCGSKSGYKADTGTNRDQWADPLARRTWTTSQSEEQDKQAILPWCGQQARGTASPAFSAISNRSIFDSRKR
jgi:hypothetical protein